MGSIVKGVGSLFGGRKRRREQKSAEKEFGAAKKTVGDFQIGDKFAGLEAQQAASQGYDAATAQAAQLGDAQGYTAQGYESQGYDAAQATAAQADQVNLGEGTGRTNQFANLQVATGAADRAAQEADQSLAATLESGAVTGGGGATALAQAALKSKQGVSDSIEQQEAANAKLRAQGATSVQQEDLAQRNLSRQTDIQQNQFNTGLEQQTSLANVAATNQASQFGASAANQAAQFGASAQNQAAQFGASAQNQFALSQFGADNQFALSNQAAQNQAAQFGAGAANQASLTNAAQGNEFALAQAQGAAQTQRDQYGQLQDQLGLASQRKQAADKARADATGDLIGGIAGAADFALGGGIGKIKGLFKKGG